jgi:signal transduction histidine kinase
LTPAARRHMAAFLRTVTPEIPRLESRFTRLLRRCGHDDVQITALCAVTPAAAARVGTVARFLKQVESEGRRLARLNVPPEHVTRALAHFDRLLDPLLGSRFGPAREQLQLAVTLTLQETFYQVREGEAQVLFGLYRAEIEASDLEGLFRRFAAILARTFRARAGRVALLPETADPRLRSPLQIERGMPQECLVLDAALRGGYASYWSFPLGDDAVVQFAFAKPVAWLPREAALVEAAAGRCREAAERLRLAAHVRRLEAESRRIEEEERRRIGRELHDEAGQSLLLLRLELELMEREAPAALRERLAGARGVTERTIAELRRIVAALSPALLERLGLEAALRQLGARFEKTCSAHLRMRISLPEAPISPESQQAIYRIAQESLHNIAKHSQATHVNLSLEPADMGVRLSVSDNGNGFRVETAARKATSFGLAGMRERAALLGGSLSVESAPGKGTRIRFFLPKLAEVKLHDEDSRIDH